VLINEYCIGMFVVITSEKFATINVAVQTNVLTVSNTAFYYLVAFTLLHD